MPRQVLREMKRYPVRLPDYLGALATLDTQMCSVAFVGERERLDRMIEAVLLEELAERRRQSFDVAVDRVFDVTRPRTGGR